MSLLFDADTNTSLQVMKLTGTLKNISVVVVVVFLFPANNTAMERYNIIQNKLLEATREAIRLIGMVALIMAYKVNKCM